MPNSRRVKVNLVHPENHFFEKVLNDWMSNASEKNGAFVIKKALDNLKKCPLKLHGYAELKVLKGIGEDIATRLDAALQCFVDRTCVDGQPLTLSSVRALKKGDALQFLCESTVSRGKRSVPFLNKDIFKAVLATIPANKSSSNPKTQKTTSSFATSSQYSQPIPSTAASSKVFAGVPGTLLPSSSAASSGVKRPAPLTQSSNPPVVINTAQSTSSQHTANLAQPAVEYMCTDDSDDENLSSTNTLRSTPANSHNSELVLIVDSRERRTDTRSKTICEVLDKKGLRYDLRPLAVGDYLWVLSMGAGPENELVLDYVVERKTWDDLKTSIRQSRYHEQKQRLRQSGIPHKILLVEGTDNKSDPALEQALVTTSIQDGFLVQRVQNANDTARFLVDTTKYMKDRLQQRDVNNFSLMLSGAFQFSGKSFAAFQEDSRKTKQQTVADYFARQLTVCPGMSTKRAGQVTAHFPSLRALRELYMNNSGASETVLANSIPGIGNSLSKQISLFFQ